MRRLPFFVRRGTIKPLSIFKPEDAMKKTLRPLGLYIHIPFCAQKCIYCDFYSLPDAAARMDDYCAALCAHLDETAETAKNHLVDTIYFGGGTPTLLGAARLVRILRCIEKKYTVAKDAEITGFTTRSMVSIPVEISGN